MAVSEDKSQTSKNIPDQILQKVAAFPSMPQAGIKLRDLLTQEDASVEEIEKILRKDPGLAANILRLANSAYFGMPTKVSSLKQAVILIGLKRFAQIAISACMSKTMGAAVPGYGLSPGALWFHSIAVSTTAEAVAKNRKLPQAGDFFMPALLHDLGKLVLGEFVRKKLPEIKNLLGKGVPWVIAERDVLGTDHAEIGALILHRWRFPADLINGVRWHHYPDGKQNRNLHPEMVYLANLLCQPEAGSQSTEDSYATPYASVLERLSINPDQFKVLVQKTRNWMQKLSDTIIFN